MDAYLGVRCGPCLPDLERLCILEDSLSLDFVGGDDFAAVSALSAEAIADSVDVMVVLLELSSRGGLR